MTDRGNSTFASMARVVADPFFAVQLFDHLPDVVFFIKDSAGRYVAVNRTLTTCCGFQHSAALIGRTAVDVFPAELGASYATQDRWVLTANQPIVHKLELHLYANRAPGWCLTHKIPLHDDQGAVIGLAGISKDLPRPDRDHPIYARLAAVMSYVEEHFAEPLTVGDLAQIARLSVAQLERHVVRLVELTPKQLIVKTRLDAAARLLLSDATVAEVAYACGYADHSAFSRQFKRTVGLSPTEYRALRQQY